MPATRLDRKFRKDPLVELFGARQRVTKIRTTEVGKAMGLGEKTARNRLNNPEEMTIKELKAACKCLGVPIEQLRECIRY